jgi:endogenous inhibitor of DNA gyrase (YacG/DUF329 family)
MGGSQSLSTILFCARCKTDDLGAWESEAYRVAASEEAPLSDESE